LQQIERKLISIVPRVNDPNPPARRLSVEGKELLIILGGRADERALARRSREAVEGKMMMRSHLGDRAPA
jgi:hypothetical protein